MHVSLLLLYHYILHSICLYYERLQNTEYNVIVIVSPHIQYKKRSHDICHKLDYYEDNH